MKLLRLLQRKEYRAVGSPVMRRADFRVIAATNRELAAMVDRGLFRRDLYYRLKVVTVRIPPLRERKEDIELLAGHFLKGFGPQYRLGPGVLEELIAHDWPGNVRELEHCIAAMIAMSSSPVLETAMLPSGIGREREASQPSSGEFEERPPGWRAKAPAGIVPLADMERQHIARALEFTRWDCAAAARMLQIGRTTLYRKIKEFGLERARAQSASSGST
jgi:DNA-binding NtrC family response regulator